MCSIISPQIQETLQRLVQGDMASFEVIVHDPNKKGEGFLGEMLFVTLRNKRNHQELNVIIKQAFTEKFIRESMPIRDIFINEINFYTKIWPQLDKFQSSIPVKYQFQKLPNCLASAADENSEKLVLENLKFQNFTLHDKKSCLNKDHFEFILIEYGKLHALSFAYKALHPEEYADLAKGLVDLWSAMSNKKFFINMVRYVYEIAMESLQPGIDDAVIEKFKPFLQSNDRYLEAVDGRTDFSVITHGDCWSNNMMFKYEQSGKLTDVRFFDYQMSRDSSPCCDLSYCIYSGASKDVLQNLDYYLQIYHDSLSDTIRQFGLDPEELYPLKELKRDWKQFCSLGFTMGLMVLKIKQSFEKDIKDFTDLTDGEEEKLLHTDYDKDEYRKISRDLLLHLYENDFL